MSDNSAIGENEVEVTDVSVPWRGFFYVRQVTMAIDFLKPGGFPSPGEGSSIAKGGNEKRHHGYAFRATRDDLRDRTETAVTFLLGC